MKIIRSKIKLKKLIKNEKNLGFVPTMGAFHQGHLSLIKKSIIQCNKTLVSIYINKPQFNKKNDFNKYPRNLRKDIFKIKSLKVDYLFLPTEEEIYPDGPNKKIYINKFKKQLCGKNRPGHFEAVADVIERFLDLLKPRNVYLGEKDMQQFIILEDYIKKRFKKIKIICCKTVRENNGLACSSRNLLLSYKQKCIGSNVYKFIKLNKKRILKNLISVKHVKKNILSLGVDKIDYVKIININKIVKPYKKRKKDKIFIAYYLKSTRLIDNV